MVCSRATSHLPDDATKRPPRTVAATLQFFHRYLERNALALAAALELQTLLQTVARVAYSLRPAG